MTNEIRIEPANVDAARSDIERTRERMSETIDEIENVLLRKREEIRSRLDLLGRARERPFVAVGIAAGSGLLLGLLTGGRTKGRTNADAERQTTIWKDRSHRLLEIAQRQRDELEALEARVTELTGRLERGRRRGRAARPSPESESRLDEIRARVSDRVDAFAAAVARPSDRR